MGCEFGARSSQTNELNLGGFIERLSRHDAVRGIVVIGSMADDSAEAASDIDLIVVVDSSAATREDASLQSAVVNIDGRVGDILFATTDEIDTILADAGELGPDEWTGRIARFLETGRIVLDRTGRLGQAQKRVKAGGVVGETPTGSGYGFWNRINYNLLHNRRMIASDDPVYLTALDVRLLYALSDVFLGYFMVRGLRWEGEKAAVRVLEKRDPDFLDLFKRCCATTGTRRRFDQYEKLCEMTIAPAGDLWPSIPASIKLRPDDSVTPGTQAKALDFLFALTADAY